MIGHVNRLMTAIMSRYSLARASRLQYRALQMLYWVAGTLHQVDEYGLREAATEQQLAKWESRALRMMTEAARLRALATA